jgi:hypothetical protein
MIRPLSMLLLAAPLLLSAQVSAAETIEKEEIMAQTQEFPIMLRGGGEAYEFGSNGFGYRYSYGDGDEYDYSDEYGDELQQGRRLWGISWSNLFCTFSSSQVLKRNAYSHTSRTV